MLNNLSHNGGTWRVLIFSEVVDILRSTVLIDS